MTPGRRVCVDCAKMPSPPKPSRPLADDRPRTPRCHTHYQAKLKWSRARNADARRKRVYGLTKADYARLSGHQGGKCPCGRNHRHVDHDHRIARRECDHPEDKACKRCLRGLLCHTCNVAILGRGYTPAMLEALADYVRDPPARTLFLPSDDTEVA